MTFFLVGRGDEIKTRCLRHRKVLEMQYEITFYHEVQIEIEGLLSKSQFDAF